MPDNNIEEIGKIKLNLVHYPGEDYYCDGDVEDELLDITRNYSAVEYQRIIEERKSWPILYHLSAQRENIVEWLPITKDMKVLEVGSGCGAITGALARKAGEVTCIDLSRKRSRINAYRHTEADNVTIHVGNFQDVEPDLPCDYDYICLIGVFEYAQSYIQSETPYEDFLNIIKKHVKSRGHIAIAIENKFGLKYWAGCKEDHLGTYFSGLENYPDGGAVRTFTAEGLRDIAQRCGYKQAQMYYPYPDYKFMTSLYSDDRLPQIGELSANLRNFDRDRLQLFDEKKVFDTIIREKQFPLFSNSYMMLLGPALEEKYVKYSNDRMPEFCIKTVLREDSTGKIIEKHPLSKEAWQHIENTARAYEKLSERYDGSGLSVNRCTLAADGADKEPYLKLEYVEGRTLEEILDDRLAHDDVDGFHRLFDEYLRRISVGEEDKIADYDLIFSNIIVPEETKNVGNNENNAWNGENDNMRYFDNAWNVIDCEWSFEKAVETKQIAFRAVYCYLLENEKRETLNLDLIMDKLKLDQSEAEQYRKEELTFQKYVTGKRMSMAEIREAIGYPVYTVDAFCEGQASAGRKDRVQIYEDTGRGFNEEQSFFLDETLGEQVRTSPEGVTELEVMIPGGRSALRIDPCNDFCLIYIREIKWNGTPVSLKGGQIQLNGFKVGENTYVFPTRDPNITLSLSGIPGEENNLLQMVMEVTKLPEETAGHIRKRGLFN
ncbi:MAG: class I SAM-dependent methyltransferase [Lachnospiraceae bacterium]|nr:class I SAM-dependent methyltransferase [Lachnospiraceae bacterium]